MSGGKKPIWDQRPAVCRGAFPILALRERGPILSPASIFSEASREGGLGGESLRGVSHLFGGQVSHLAGGRFFCGV